MSIRHDARILAMQFLFQRDFHRAELDPALQEFWEEHLAAGLLRRHLEQTAGRTARLQDELERQKETPADHSGSESERAIKLAELIADLLALAEKHADEFEITDEKDEDAWHGRQRAELRAMVHAFCERIRKIILPVINTRPSGAAAVAAAPLQDLASLAAKVVQISGKHTAALERKQRDEYSALEQFAEGLIRGVEGQRTELDALLVKYSEHWALDRMAGVDRNILRLALFEMMHRPDVPPVVSINEAVEIAKQFGDPDSRKFINGVLDRIRVDILRPAREPMKAGAIAITPPEPPAPAKMPVPEPAKPRPLPVAAKSDANKPLPKTARPPARRTARSASPARDQRPTRGTSPQKRQPDSRSSSNTSRLRAPPAARTGSGARGAPARARPAPPPSLRKRGR